MDTYRNLLNTLPVVEWNLFMEDRDNVEGAQTLACTAGGCEI